MDLPFSTKLKIHLQRILGNISFLFIGLVVVIFLKFYYKFSIINHSQHKKYFRNLVRNKKPLLICSNHLTMIDSVILQYAFGSYFYYLFHFRNFIWNVPAKEVFAKNVFLNVFLFLTKCIPIDRKGSPEYHEFILNQIQYILLLKDPFLIFPEGGRSRKGIFDLENITYGVGRILFQLPNTQVLCVYLRGDKQKHYTNFPEKNSKFYIKYRLIQPKTKHTKRILAEKDLTLQIGKTIKELEEEYLLDQEKFLVNQ
ncbi:MAG: 1-acyl-sn-glycerol-3-phosphate acyltransferase [Candidatus Omnitrophica bacterium]|nr:1-acyl-sn-glycerol-3-phosphate acyltransferase [Candidatus Omnitrophota bacterium]